MFRGYLLFALAQWLGTTRAPWLLALPFGLFHFPGFDAFALSKMVIEDGRDAVARLLSRLLQARRGIARLDAAGAR